MAGSETVRCYRSRAGYHARVVLRWPYGSALVGAVVIMGCYAIVGCDRKSAVFCSSKFLQKHDVASFIAAFSTQEHITERPSIADSLLPDDPNKQWNLRDVCVEIDGRIGRGSRFLDAYCKFVERELQAKQTEESDARVRVGRQATGRHDGYVFSGGQEQFFLRYGIGDNVGIFFCEVSAMDQGKMKLHVVMYEEMFE